MDEITGQYSTNDALKYASSSRLTVAYFNLFRDTRLARRPLLLVIRNF